MLIFLPYQSVKSCKCTVCRKARSSRLILRAGVAESDQSDSGEQASGCQAGRGI